IAKFAAGQVEENDTIFINTSSTALLVLKYIKRKHVTVITNNGKVLLMDYDPKISVLLTGGEVRNPKEALVGEFALNNLSLVTADKFFIGVSGISAKSGLTSALISEVAVNKNMLSRCSGKIFVLADHTKIGIDHSFQSGSLRNIDYLITDTKADQKHLNDIEKQNVGVIALEPLKSLATII
ncbi:MAG: DeoR/GlpR transcriptional regulator, partial [Erysipelothrix sp.]|nr:DeoR/GlpR transcriptional regulator [Erysipelothrix sp.]